MHGVNIILEENHPTSQQDDHVSLSVNQNKSELPAARARCTSFGNGVVVIYSVCGATELASDQKRSGIDGRDGGMTVHVQWIPVAAMTAAAVIHNKTRLMATKRKEGNGQRT